jgi:hypothetical protein
MTWFTLVPDQTDLILPPPDIATEPIPRSEGSPDAAPFGQGIVATWLDVLPASQDLDGGLTPLLARFGADGRPLGAPLAVTRDPSGSATDSEAALLPGGRMAVGWTVREALAPDAGARVHAVLLDPATGETVGGEVRLPAAFAIDFLEVLPLPGGRAGILWRPYLIEQAVAFQPTRLTLLEADGTQGETVVLAMGWDRQEAGLLQAVALEGANAGLIAVHAYRPGQRAVSDPAADIRFLRLDGSAGALPSIALDRAFDAATLRMAALADGGLLVVTPGDESHSLVLRRHDAAGQLRASVPIEWPEDVLPWQVVALPGGGAIVAATRLRSSGTSDGTLALAHVSAANEVDAGFLPIAGGSRDIGEGDLLVLPDGRMVVVWAEGAFPGGETTVRASWLALTDGDPPPPPPGAQDPEPPRLQAGSDGPDRLFGTDWQDILVGAGGNDRLRDLFFNADTLDGGEGDDSLFGGNAGSGDLLLGGRGDDKLHGRGGDDTIEGGEGNDRLQGDFEQDRLRGGPGRDRLFGGQGDDSLAGDDGDDRLFGGPGADTLEGGEGRERLQGDESNDLLRGGPGADRLFGGAGADTLEGGAGADTMRGAEGANLFRFLAIADSPSDEPDLVLGFGRGGPGRLDLSAIDADPLTAADDAFAFIGMAPFAGGEGVAQMRQVSLAASNALRLELDDGDADALPDMVILLEGARPLLPSDILL